MKVKKSSQNGSEPELSKNNNHTPKSTPKNSHYSILDLPPSLSPRSRIMFNHRRNDKPEFVSFPKDGLLMSNSPSSLPENCKVNVTNKKSDNASLSCSPRVPLTYIQSNISVRISETVNGDIEISLDSSNNGKNTIEDLQRNQRQEQKNLSQRENDVETRDEEVSQRRKSTLVSSSVALTKRTPSVRFTQILVTGTIELPRVTSIEKESLYYTKEDEDWMFDEYGTRSQDSECLSRVTEGD